jgi:uncharacterized protein (DUF433 family)
MLEGVMGDQAIHYGRYIVADPEICHGALTFKGTRIFVDDVLRDVARNKPWDEIIRRWHASIDHEAIAEAVALAGSAMHEYEEQERPTLA